MRILLDECVPARLQREFPGHEVRTVPQAGWAGISNGKLLRLIAASGRFDLFLTVDKKLPHQQKIQSLPFPIVLLRAQSNDIASLRQLVPELLRRLPGLKPGQVMMVGQPD